MRKKRKAKNLNKQWYFICPQCSKATTVVTELLAVPCGGRWCRGLVDLKANQITQDEYNRRWGI